jgi:hypothetical protein
MLTVKHSMRSRFWAGILLCLVGGLLVLWCFTSVNLSPLRWTPVQESLPSDGQELTKSFTVLSDGIYSFDVTIPEPDGAKTVGMPNLPDAECALKLEISQKGTTQIVNLSKFRFSSLVGSEKTYTYEALMASLSLPKGEYSLRLASTGPCTTFRTGDAIFALSLAENPTNSVIAKQLAPIVSLVAIIVGLVLIISVLIQTRHGTINI